MVAKQKKVDEDRVIAILEFVICVCLGDTHCVYRGLILHTFYRMIVNLIVCTGYFRTRLYNAFGVIWSSLTSN